MQRPGAWAIAILCLAGAGVNALILAPAGEYTARGQTDFMDLYAGGKLAFTGDLYATDRVLETEARTEGMSSRTRLFLRLPCFALFFRPLALLPYRVASPLWEGLCVCSMLLFAVLFPGRRRWQVALACCWSLPAWMAVAEGQDIGFILLWIAIASALVRKRHPVGAGMVASLCLAKFHLFLLIPVWICARRQWRFAGGLTAGGAVLLALSFVAGGLDWPLQYFRLLREPSNNPYLDVMPNFHALVAGLPGAAALEIAGIAVVAAAVWVASRGARPEWGLAAALAGGVLVAPHAYLADGALVLPAVLLLAPRCKRRGVRMLSFLLLTPLPWVLVMIGAGMAARVALFALLLSLASGRGFIFRNAASRLLADPEMPADQLGRSMCDPL